MIRTFRDLYTPFAYPDFRKGVFLNASNNTVGGTRVAAKDFKSAGPCIAKNSNVYFGQNLLHQRQGIEQMAYEIIGHEMENSTLMVVEYCQQLSIH